MHVAQPFPLNHVSKRLVNTLRKTMETTMDAATEKFYDFGRAPNLEWNRWCLGQPRAQRSYLRRINDFGWSTAWLTYVNGLDHARALVDLYDVRDKYGLRTWSYLTMARGAQEALIRAAVLTDRSTPPERHLLRSAASTLDGWLEQKRMAEDYTDVERKTAQRLLDLELGRFRRAGITVNEYKGKIKSVERGGIRVNLAIDLTTESRKRMEEVPSPYRIGSATAHSGAWFLASALRDLGDGEVQPVADPDVMFTAAALVLFGLLAASKAVTPEDQQAVHYELRNGVLKGTGRALSYRLKDHGRGRENVSRSDQKS